MAGIDSPTSLFACCVVVVVVVVVVAVAVAVADMILISFLRNIYSSSLDSSLQFFEQAVFNL
jgi:hypothetical protein